MRHIRNHNSASDTDPFRMFLVALRSKRFPFIGESHGVCAITGYLRRRFEQLQVDKFDMQITAPAELMEEISRSRPSILGFSVKQQTFDQLIEIHELIRQRIPQRRRPLIVVGNTIPNLSGLAIIDNYLPGAIIGRGEGEIVLGDLFLYTQGLMELDDVRNIIFKEMDGSLHLSKKEYLAGSEIPQPNRSSTLEFYRRGGEIYIEGSRGCAYGKCTFCACSHLLGSHEKSTKWRPRPIPEIVGDLRNLMSMNIHEVTFADEDFFGFGRGGIERARELAEAIIDGQVRINFRINVWVKSIFSAGAPGDLQKEREDCIRSLKEAGLVKVFLGLESGSESQLKRYQKGFQLKEFCGAFELIDRNDIDCEFGFILLDPLMEMREARESLDFLERQGYTHKISSIYKEMRVQVGNPYVQQVRQFEKETGESVLGDLEFNYQQYAVHHYTDPDVDFFARSVREWVELAYRLYYSLRIFTQYSMQARWDDACRADRIPFFSAIKSLREIEFEMLKEICSLIEHHGRDLQLVKTLLRSSEEKRRREIELLLSLLGGEFEDKEVESIREESMSYLRNSTLYLEKL